MMIFMMVDLFAAGILMGFLIGQITQYYRLKRILGFDSLPLPTPNKNKR